MESTIRQKRSDRNDQTEIRQKSDRNRSGLFVDGGAQTKLFHFAHFRSDRRTSPDTGARSWLTIRADRRKKMPPAARERSRGVDEVRVLPRREVLVVAQVHDVLELRRRRRQVARRQE